LLRPAAQRERNSPRRTESRIGRDSAGARRSLIGCPTSPSDWPVDRLTLPVQPLGLGGGCRPRWLLSCWTSKWPVVSSRRRRHPALPSAACLWRAGQACWPSTQRALRHPGGDRPRVRATGGDHDGGAATKADVGPKLGAEEMSRRGSAVIKQQEPPPSYLARLLQEAGAIHDDYREVIARLAYVAGIHPVATVKAWLWSPPYIGPGRRAIPRWRRRECGSYSEFGTGSHVFGCYFSPSNTTGLQAPRHGFRSARRLVAAIRP
jgi:hypothetical protein